MTRPCLTERLLMLQKNQIQQTNNLREVTSCGKCDFPYHKELFLKEEITPSAWEQILSFKRSSRFEKGRN